jgi:hypothetical protein
MKSSRDNNQRNQELKRYSAGFFAAGHLPELFFILLVIGAHPPVPPQEVKSVVAVKITMMHVVMGSSSMPVNPFVLDESSGK